MFKHFKVKANLFQTSKQLYEVKLSSKDIKLDLHKRIEINEEKQNEMVMENKTKQNN